MTLPASAPREAVKVEFARRLRTALIQKGWTQSELARMAEKHLKGGQRFGRDTISQYMRAKSLPGPIFLDAICKALGKAPDDLLPSRGMPTIGEPSAPPFEFRDMSDGTAWLRINKRYSISTVLKMLELDQKDKLDK